MWGQVLLSQTIEMCQIYMDTFPRGEHYDEVQEMYEELYGEEQDWLETKDVLFAGLYIDFLRKHPDGKHYTEARLMIDSILWDEAKNSSVAYNYQNYIENAPWGKHIEEARAQLAEIEKKTLTTKEAEMASSVTRSFFNALSSRDEEMLMNTVSNPLIFYGRKVTKSRVLSYMYNLYAEDVYGLNINVSDVKVKKNIKGEQIQYEVTFVANMHIDREDTSKTTYSNNEGTALVNTDFKIVSFLMRRVAGN